MTTRAELKVANAATALATNTAVSMGTSTVTQTAALRVVRKSLGNVSFFRFMVRKRLGIPPHGSHPRAGDTLRGPQPNYAQTFAPVTVTQTATMLVVAGNTGVRLGVDVRQTATLTMTQGRNTPVAMKASNERPLQPRSGGFQAQSRTAPLKRPLFTNPGFTMSAFLLVEQPNISRVAVIFQNADLLVTGAQVALQTSLRTVARLTVVATPTGATDVPLVATVTQTASLIVVGPSTPTGVIHYNEGTVTYSSSLATYDGDVAGPPPATAPTISGFSPLSGGIGTTVTVTGTNFTDATAVAFNGVPAAFTIVTDTVLITAVPTGASSGSISVTNPAGTGTSPTSFLIPVAPPPPPPAPGTTEAVQLGFPPVANSGSFLALDSATQGHLNTAFTLAPEVVWTDITNFTANIAIRRGKNRELDERTEAGSCTITVRNETRRFDPSNRAGPYYPNIAPRSWLRVAKDGVWQFTGQIEDIQPNYDTATASVTFVAADALSQLADAKVTLTNPAIELPGARIARILNLAGYHGGTDIAAGRALISSEDFAGSALDELSRIAQLEATFLFVDPNGNVTYLDRTTLINQAPSVILADNNAGGHIQYSDLDQQYGSELLWNEVSVTRRGEGAKPQGVGDLDSIDRFGKRTLEITDIPCNTDQDALYLAQFLLARYRVPVLRFSSVRTPLRRWGLAVRQSLLALDIGSVVKVQRTPKGQGSPLVIDQDCTIIGIEHDAVPGNWTTRYMLESVEAGSVNASGYVTLDSTAFGQLDVNSLGF